MDKEHHTRFQPLWFSLFLHHSCNSHPFKLRDQIKQKKAACFFWEQTMWLLLWVYKAEKSCMLFWGQIVWLFLGACLDGNHREGVGTPYQDVESKLLKESPFFWNTKCVSGPIGGFEPEFHLNKPTWQVCHWPPLYYILSSARDPGCTVDSGMPLGSYLPCQLHKEHPNT